MSIGVLQPLQTENSPIFVNLEKSVLCQQKLITSTPIFPNRRKTFAPFKRRRLSTKRTRRKISDPISKFVECLSRPSVINQLFTFHTGSKELLYGEEIGRNCTNQLNTMLPSMPSLSTPIKKTFQNGALSSVAANIDKNEEKVLTNIDGNKNDKKNALPEISTISSSSFQQANSDTEVEFCRPTDNCQAVTCNTESILGNFSLTNQEIPFSNNAQDSTGLEKVSNHEKQNLGS